MTFVHPSLVISWNPMEEVETPSDQDIEYYQGIENDYGTLADGINNLYPGTLEEKVFSSGQVNDASMDQVNYDVEVSHELIAGAYNPQNTVDAIKNHTLKIKDTTPPVETYFPSDTIVDKNQVQNAIGNPVYSDNSGLPITHNYSIALDETTSEYNKWIVNHTGTDIAGNSVTSPQYIREDLNVGIDNLKLAKTKVYPNPSNGTITLELQQLCKNVQVYIKNSLGQCIQEQSFWQVEKVEITLPNTSGIYFVFLESENESFVIQVIKK